mmetsp:Transcript_24609/g.21834  ORF Transcript_24609/g.21834 Transcript_24609/m.21834 type:complete len:108 (+) Transcript_24609:23-346(+)
MSKYFSFAKSDKPSEEQLVEDPEYGSYEKIDKKKDDLLVSAFKQVWEKKSQQLRDTIEESVDTGKSYKYFAVFLGIGCLFLLLSLLFLPTIVFSPHKFAMLFTLGSL